jgi:hypothetical protein
MPTIVYDTGALLATQRGNPDFQALHDELTAARMRPIVPVVVLAQAWRGGPQPQISQVLKACDIVPDDQRIGHAAGVACTASTASDVVDVIVIATAIVTRPPSSPATPATWPTSPAPSASKSACTQPDQHRLKARRSAASMHTTVESPAVSTATASGPL